MKPFTAHRPFLEYLQNLTSYMLNQAINALLNRKQLAIINSIHSEPKAAYSAARSLWLRGHSADFWTSIASDANRPFFQRRLAVVQYFVRHAFHQPLNIFARGATECGCQLKMIKALGFFMGAMPLTEPGRGGTILTLKPNLPPGNTTTIYFLFRPAVNEDDIRTASLDRVVSKDRIDSSIQDVGASETIEDGTHIVWYRYKFPRLKSEV